MCHTDREVDFTCSLRSLLRTLDSKLQQRPRIPTLIAPPVANPGLCHVGREVDFTRRLRSLTGTLDSKIQHRPGIPTDPAPSGQPWNVPRRQGGGLHTQTQTPDWDPGLRTRTETRDPDSDPTPTGQPWSLPRRQGGGLRMQPQILVWDPGLNPNTDPGSRLIPPPVANPGMCHVGREVGFTRRLRPLIGTLDSEPPPRPGIPTDPAPSGQPWNVPPTLECAT